MTEKEVCSACGKMPDEHAALRHPFTPKGASTSWLKPQKIQSPASTPMGHVPQTSFSMPATWPFDPVLRQALINKGVITPEELENARKGLEALGLGGALSGPAEPQGPTPG